LGKRILVIEDNHDLAKLIELHFKDESWRLDLAFDGKTGFKKARTGGYDLIILDIMLPGMDGMAILKGLRGGNILTPVIMLTSRSSEIDRILGLEFGADDYVTKPFSVRELVARVKALFRRIEAVTHQGEVEPRENIVIGEVTLVPEKRLVIKSGVPVDLTAKEFDLLCFFARHPGRVFNRSQLLDRVWGYGHDGYDHAVNSHINRLRAKIETDPAAPKYILTVWGVGYKFRDR